MEFVRFRWFSNDARLVSHPALDYAVELVIRLRCRRQYDQCYSKLDGACTTRA